MGAHNVILDAEGYVLGYPRLPQNLTGVALLHVSEFARDPSDEAKSRLIKVLPEMPARLPRSLVLPAASEEGKIELSGVELVRVPRRTMVDTPRANAPAEQFSGLDSTAPEAFEDPTELTADLELDLRYGILRSCIVRQCLRAAYEGRKCCVVRFPRWCRLEVERELTPEEMQEGRERLIISEDYMAKLCRELSGKQFIRLAEGIISGLLAHDRVGPFMTPEERALGEIELERRRSGELRSGECPLCLFISWDAMEAPKPM